MVRRPSKNLVQSLLGQVEVFSVRDAFLGGAKPSARAGVLVGVRVIVPRVDQLMLVREQQLQRTAGLADCPDHLVVGRQEDLLSIHLTLALNPKTPAVHCTDTSRIPVLTVPASPGTRHEIRLTATPHGSSRTPIVPTVWKDMVSFSRKSWNRKHAPVLGLTCLLYTSDAADEEDSVDLGGRRIIKKKKNAKKIKKYKNTKQKMR
eukprot:TRINITY_DN7897_c0_g1_i3.p1 TRINITY_DN7897_c0_g1~~TRINITY_DN7897_c0_g1_i3.p1  ORF type:complete len:205 (-),score=28.31 TRINITY_DN7897_c0_g1_i3:68-682(-)